MKIMLDAGHGGTDPGASGTMSYYGDTPVTILEKNLTLSLADSTYYYLQNYLSATVYRTRTGDTNVSIADRSAVAHNNAVDAVLSIHFNAFNGTSIGVETYYAQTRSGDSSFANAIQSNVVSLFNPNSRGVKNDTQSGPGSLGILRNYPNDTYPRALIEVEFIDNQTAMNNLLGYDYYERTLDFAAAIVAGFQNYFGIRESFDAELAKAEYKKNSPDWKTICNAVNELKGI